MALYAFNGIIRCFDISASGIGLT